MAGILRGLSNSFTNESSIQTQLCSTLFARAKMCGPLLTAKVSPRARAQAHPGIKADSTRKVRPKQNESEQM
jgi:hypothetical protein